MLKDRLRGAAYLVLILVAALAAGRPLLLPLSLICFLIASYEFFTLAAPISRRFVGVHCALSLLSVVGFWVAAWPGFVAGFVAALFLIFALHIWVIEHEVHELPYEQTLPAAVLGFAYCGGALALLPIAALRIENLLAILWLILVVAATDSCAYFGGRALKTSLLAPRVSPKKTWGGVYTGTLSAVLVGGGAYLLLGPRFNIGAAALLALVVSVVSQVGDLAESLIKRIYRVKDSGDLIPGHGGVLDRIDGYIFSLPILLLLGL